ncbi:MAG: 3-hydroxybutyryl-CoA dehydrogenase [Dehalobacterium sp.]
MNNNMKLVAAVVGCGRMGVGIAQVFAYAGHSVLLIDAKERAEEQRLKLAAFIKDQITANLSFLSRIGMVEKRMIPNIMARINFYQVSQLNGVLSEANIIFEAVPEVLEIKKDVYTDISALATKDTIIASTTSTFLADQLAEYVSHAERFLCTHWLNPAYLMPLVEVSPGKETAPEKLQHVFTLLEALGKIPVRCNPSPGFIVPRIQALAMNEAARLAEEGVASPEDIDKASRFGFGLRFAVLGLLEFIDWGGGDILYYAGHNLHKTLGEDRFLPPKVIVQNMEQGRNGIKSGKGFFDYSQCDLTKYQEETLTKFVDLLKHLGLMRSPVS